MAMLRRSQLSLYEEFFARRNFERRSLFASLASTFRPTRALYPGSFVHVTPSFALESVTYVDTDRRCRHFFRSKEVRSFVEGQKAYAGAPEITFMRRDYRGDLGLAEGQFDLLISQYAGPVSQECKRHLRLGGLLVANDSHGDATLAQLDPDYRLVAVVLGEGDQLRLEERDLDAYFHPRYGVQPTASEVLQRGRSPIYTRTAVAYVFERVR